MTNVDRLIRMYNALSRREKRNQFLSARVLIRELGGNSDQINWPGKTSEQPQEEGSNGRR